MKSGFDISLIKGDECIVLSVSLAKIEMGQRLEEICRVFDYFARKLHTFSNDVVVLYTSGLYFNSDEITYKERVKYNQ
jgi:uncharacterized Fe-S cluster-containing MiaB family protein